MFVENDDRENGYSTQHTKAKPATHDRPGGNTLVAQLKGGGGRFLPILTNVTSALDLGGRNLQIQG
jgi:hypothetical protein